MNYRLPKFRRVRSSQDFERIYSLRQRAGDRHLLVFGAPRQTAASDGRVPDTRFGLSVSKKHGNAVKRARLKRLLREAFRLTQHDLPPGLDLILIPRKDSGATLDDFKASLSGAARKLARRLRIRES